MEKRYYNTTSIRETLLVFERSYELDSEDFFRAHVENDERIAHVPGFHRQTWAGFYRTWMRMSDSSGFAAQVERELEPA
ncbi:hypothetical protein BH20ACT19_BH20ACT19_00250 [soil metagenome]